MKDFWIRGKNIVIVGATTLVGRYLTYKLIEIYNCKVFAISENQSGLDIITDNVGEYGTNLEAHCFKTSLEKNWENFANYLTDNSKSVDILINTTVNIPKFNKFDMIDQREINQTMNTNFYSSVFSTRHLLPFLKNSRHAGIINISYLLDEYGNIGSSAYVSSASALQSYTEVLSEELKNVYVCLVKVGRAKTDIYANQSKEIIERVSKRVMSVDKLTDRIIKGISKKHKHIVVGTYAHTNELFAKFLPDIKNKLEERRRTQKGIKLIDSE